MITNLVGKPDNEFIESIKDIDNKKFMQQLPETSGKFIEEFSDYQNKEAIDLLGKMLVFDPNKRITLDEALAHPYMSRLHWPDDEPTGDPLDDYDFEFEKYDLTASEYVELIDEEIKLFSDEDARELYV